MFPVNGVDEVFMLDLCTLAYQLHSQALVFTFDPYLEQMKLGSKGPGANRRDFFAALNSTIDDLKGSYDLRLRGLRGPERLMGDDHDGWTGRADLDPVLYDWDQISPRRPGMSRQNREGEGVLVYSAPPNIMSRIGNFYTVQYDTSEPPFLVTDGAREGDNTATGDPMDANVMTKGPFPVHPGGTDTIYIFEGATGVDKGGHGLWSPMGFVLVRVEANGVYDLFIVFRGSRSGKLRIKPSLRGTGAADWVTDLAISQHNYPGISTEGKVHHGLARCLLSMTPTISECLNAVHNSQKVDPRRIFVSGHSLGAALAHLMVGSRVAGDGSAWSRLNNDVAQWNFRGMPVRPIHGPAADGAIAALFAAPPVGDRDLHKEFFRGNDNVKNYFLNLDIVAGFRDQHKRYKMFHTKNSPARAHSPDLIRKHLQDHYRTNAPNPQAQPGLGVRPYRDELAPFCSHERPSDAFNAVKEIVNAPNSIPEYSKNAAINFALYLKTLGKSISTNANGSADASDNLKEIDQALIELEKFPNLRMTDLENIFNRLRRTTLIDQELSGMGLARMFQAWIWLVWIEQLTNYDAVDNTFVPGIALPDKPWITESGYIA